MRPSLPAGALALIGAGLVVGTNLAAGEPNLGMLGFTAWALVPYALLWGAAKLRPKADPWLFIGAGGAALAAEAGVRLSVFAFPRGSTAAVALAFSPAWILMFALPAGALAGVVLGWTKRRGPVPHACAGIAYGAAAALLTISLARPDLMPNAVLARKAALRAIGEPRVAAGGERFRKVVVSGVQGWHLAAELDGKAGEELAVAGARGADLYDPSNLSPKGRVEFSPSLRWSWFSTLARVDGSVKVVQTGGGYSDTEVLSPDGTVLWKYRPDAALPPNALRPADLDGSGKIAFYAATQTALVRLDGAGKEVWSRPMRSPSLVALAPRAPRATAWIAAWEYGAPVRIWDESGVELGKVALAPNETPLSIVDWPIGRGLLVASSEGTARVLGLTGGALFEYPLAPLRPVGAESIRAAKDAEPLLALLAAGPRGVPRWRLLLLDAKGETVYDEVFDKPLRLLKARLPGGGEALFLSSGDGLSALR